MQISLSLVELIKINGNFVALLNIVTLTLNINMNDRFAKVSKFFPNSYGIRQNAALALLIKILDV